MSEPQQTKQKREPLLDHEDWLYIVATGCIGGGAGLLSLGAGFICVGVMLLGWPLMARLCVMRA